MKRNRAKAVVTGTILTASLFVSMTGYAAASFSITVEETPLAGITLSLDKYCENVLANEQEEAAQAQQEAEEAEAEQETDEETAEDAEDADDSDGETTLITTSKTKKEKVTKDLGYDNLGVANVDTYLNVRKSGSESARIVGKMTKNAGCNVISIKKGWAKIESGSVKGYVKAKYLLTGSDALKRATKVAKLRALVKTETLNVRYLPSTDAPIYDQISEDEYYTVVEESLTKEYVKNYISKNISKKTLKSVDTDAMYENLDNWVMISIDDEKAFVSKDFIKLKYKLNRAVTISQSSGTPDGSSASSSSSTASSIVSYAMQFLGNPYVWGGTSLTNGTDCSGFTMSIYSHFGYYLPRTSAAQAAYTTTVSSGDVQVGDLFFYGSGSVSHVALYIGNGQVIHASNARDGIKISSAYYRQPLKIGRVMN